MLERVHGHMVKKVRRKRKNDQRTREWQRVYNDQVNIDNHPSRKTKQTQHITTIIIAIRARKILIESLPDDGAFSSSLLPFLIT